MEFNHLEHRLDVVLRHWLRHTTASRLLVTWERPHRAGELRAFRIRFAGHDPGNRATKRAAFNAVVTVAIAHDERAKIRVTETECAENMRVLCDVFDRITGVVDDDFL